MGRRTIGRLTARAVEGLKRPGHFADGGGLYLQVSETESRSWVFRYQRAGRRREMGLGSFPAVGLKEARGKAATVRADLGAGKDPLAERQAERARRLTYERGTVSFREAAEQFIAAHAPGWRNPKHRQQWTNTLATYAHPVIGDLPIAAIDTQFVLRVLEPIWTQKTETASRLRGRIEAVLDWAAVRGMRTGENPARWRGHLDKLLPRRACVAPVEHHPALAYAEVPRFLADRRRQPGIAARALEFAILTAARTGEVIGAKWEEVEGEVWTIPGSRMKASREHRVPLAARVLAIAGEMRQAKTDEFVFPGGRDGKPLSNMAMAAVLKRMGRHDITAHGFRSSFRDWAGETTAFPREVIEHALAHQLRDKAEAAYARGALWEAAAVDGYVDGFEEREPSTAGKAVSISQGSSGLDIIARLPRSPLVGLACRSAPNADWPRTTSRRGFSGMRFRTICPSNISRKTVSCPGHFPGGVIWCDHQRGFPSEAVPQFVSC